MTYSFLTSKFTNFVRVSIPRRATDIRIVCMILKPLVTLEATHNTQVHYPVASSVVIQNSFEFTNGVEETALAIHSHGKIAVNVNICKAVIAVASCSLHSIACCV